MNTSNEACAMILAAGLGTRLGDMTKAKPKALVEINGRPLIEILMQNLKFQGFNTVIVNTHHFANQLTDYLQTNTFGLKIYISDERNCLMDTGGAIVQANRFFPSGSSVLVHNVDIISNIDLKNIYDNFQLSGDDAWLVTQDRISSRKILSDFNDLLCGWTNKSTKEFKWVNNSKKEKYNELAFSGIHLFKKELFDGLPLRPSSVIDLYIKLAATKKIKCQTAPCSYWFDLGKVNDLPRIEEHLKTIRL